jgi:hypothetical protein
VRFGSCATSQLDFRRGRGVTVAGTPEHGAVVLRARELVRFARQHGYRLDELVRIIEDVDDISCTHIRESAARWESAEAIRSSGPACGNVA